MGKIAASVLLKLSSLVMKDATPLTPLAHERNCKQHTLNDHKGPGKKHKINKHVCKHFKGTQFHPITFINDVTICLAAKLLI